MRPYTRPLLKSSRVRHFAAGAAGVLLLVALTAASGVGIAPTSSSEGIMDLKVDVRDVPCDEPFDESDRVQVIPDTSTSGRIQVQVVVRNRNCCCCEGTVSGPLGELRGARSSGGVQSAPRAASTPAPEPLATRQDVQVVPVVASAQPTQLSSFGPLSARPVSNLPLGSPVAAPVTPVGATVSAARVPWWLALAAVPAAFLAGGGSGQPCQDDETGARSGPSRTC